MKTNKVKADDLFMRAVLLAEQFTLKGSILAQLSDNLEIITSDNSMIIGASALQQRVWDLSDERKKIANEIFEIKNKLIALV